MTYEEAVRRFLDKILLIFNSNPKRREPGDGSDGYCDCIGLIIGAIRRMGLKWIGIHGSNWAARKEIVNLRPIKSQSELQVGDIVLKGITNGKTNWALPTRYRSGGKYFNGDLTDYYHAGVVYSINPFQIRHMSSKMSIDTKVNTFYPWNYYGKSRHLVEASKGSAVISIPSVSVPSTGKLAIVTARQGATVNMRHEPNLKARLITRVPLGKTIEIVSPGEEWCKIKYDSFTGYMMAQFLDVIGDGKGKY